MSVQDRIQQKFQELVEEARAILVRCGWDGREYRRFPDDVEYLRFRTEALNLVRRVCGKGSDHHGELVRLTQDKNAAKNPYYLTHCLGVVEAAQRDFEGDLLFDLRALVTAELLGDFLDQAEYLVGEGYHVPAASLAGAVLEDTLRKLCARHEVPFVEKTKIDRLNADLAKAGIYNTLVQKRITALADIRNNADHGRFDEFTKDDVVDMVKWARKFAADYLH